MSQSAPVEAGRLSETEARVIAALGDGQLGRPCYAYREVASTMDVAHQLARAGAAEGTCVWAERQTAGRGRAGRHWASPPGGLYLSVVLRPARAVAELPQLALVAGLAAVQAIHALTKLPARLRWPNDVLLNGKKVVGVLTEMTSEGAAGQYVVVGIGMNVQVSQKELPDEATSLSRWSEAPLDRPQMAAALLSRFELLYGHWSRSGFSAIHPGLVQWVGVFGKMVQIATAKDRFEGQVLDLDEAGRLLIRLDSGVVRAVDVGDVLLLT